MSNSLGIGSCGKTYNLMPKHLNNKPFLNNSFIKDTKKFNYNNNIFSNSNTNSNVPYIDTNTIENNISTVENNIIKEESYNNEKKQNIDSNQKAKKSEYNTIPKTRPTENTIEKHFDKLFLESNTIQLMGIFRRVKNLTNKSKKLINHKLAYIDYRSMKQLIEKAKSEQSNNGVMSLKSYVKQGNQDMVNFDMVDEFYQKIQMLEVLGPPESAIITLDNKQIKYLKDIGVNQYFWPKGSEGILWFHSSS